MKPQFRQRERLDPHSPDAAGRMKTRLGLAQLANSIGDGAYLVCSALYFTRIVGLSPTQVGLALTLGWAAGFVAGVPLGHLADRRGARGVAVILALVTAAALTAFLFVGTFGTFLAVAIVYAVAQTGLATARQAILAGVIEPPNRTAVRAYLQGIANAGLAVGAGMGGAALYFDTRAAYLTVFVLDALGFVAAAVILRGLPPVRASVTLAKLDVLRDRPYALVTAINTVMLLYMPLLSLVIPLWIVQRTEAPRWMVSALLILNTLSVMLFQVRIARRVSGLASASRLVRHSGLLMLASCAVFAVSSIGTSALAAAAVLVVAAALQVVGEMMLASGAWEISFELAPADKQGQYQGFFGTGTAVARMAGPLLLTALVIGLGTPGWLILGALFALAGAAMLPAVRWAQRTRVPAAAGA